MNEKNIHFVSMNEARTNVEGGIYPKIEQKGNLYGIDFLDNQFLTENLAHSSGNTVTDRQYRLSETSVRRVGPCLPVDFVPLYVHRIRYDDIIHEDKVLFYDGQ